MYSYCTFSVLLPSLKDGRIEEGNHLPKITAGPAGHGTRRPCSPHLPTQVEVWVPKDTFFLQLYDKLLKETKFYMFWCAPASHTMPCKQETEESFRNENHFTFLLKNALGNSCHLEGSLKAFHDPASADSPGTPPRTTIAPSSRGTGLESPCVLYSLLLALILWSTMSYYRNAPSHPPNLGEVIPCGAFVSCASFIPAHSISISNGLPSLHCWPLQVRLWYP